MARKKKPAPNPVPAAPSPTPATTSFGRRFGEMLVSAVISASFTVYGSYFLFRPDVYAQFSCTPEAGSAPLVINCFNESMYAKDIVWDFGDGTPPVRSEETVNHRYGTANSDPYIVKLTAIGKGRDQTTHNIHVRAPLALESAQRLSLRAVKASSIETTLKSCEISFTNDTHSSLLNVSVKTYPAQCDADEGFQITSARFVPVSQTRASVSAPAVVENGTSATMTARITAGPQVDRYRGWLRGRIELTQQRSSPESTITLAKNLEVSTYGLYALDTAVPASAVDSIALRIDSGESVSLKPGQVYAATAAGASYTLLDQDGRLYLNVTPLPGIRGDAPAPRLAPMVQAPQQRTRPTPDTRSPPSSLEDRPPVQLSNGSEPRDRCQRLTAEVRKWSGSTALASAGAGVLDLAAQIPDEQCVALASVMSKVTEQKTTGGRRLEDDKPLDIPAAQADLAKALEDETLRTQYNAAQTTYENELARLIYQAMILDEEGFYAARDLLILQAKEKLRQ